MEGGDYKDGMEGGGYQKMLDAYLSYLEANEAEGNGQGFMVGTRLSAADLTAFSVICNWYKSFDRERFMSKYPRLEVYIQQIAAIPEVTHFIRTEQPATTWFPEANEKVLGFGMKLSTPEELLGLTAAKASRL